MTTARSQDCALRKPSLRCRRTWSFEAARALPDLNATREKCPFPQAAPRHPHRKSEQKGKVPRSTPEEQQHEAIHPPGILHQVDRPKFLRDRAQHDAAPCNDYPLFFSSHAAKCFCFRLSEFFFAVFRKDFWNRHPELRSNDFVRVMQSQTCSAMEGPSHGRFTRAHHPDKDNRSAELIHRPISHRQLASAK